MGILFLHLSIFVIRLFGASLFNSNVNKSPVLFQAQPIFYKQGQPFSDKTNGLQEFQISATVGIRLDGTAQYS